MFIRMLSGILLLFLVSCAGKSPATGTVQPQVPAPSPSEQTGLSDGEIQTCYPGRKLPADNPALPRRAVRAQKEQIAADLPMIRSRLKTLRKDHALEERLQRRWLREQKKYQRMPKIISPETGQEIERFQNQYYWGQCNGSFFALPGKTVFQIQTNGIAHNIRALHSLYKMLSRCHIQMLILLIPDAEQIARCGFMSDTTRIGDPVSLQCAATMLEYGMEAIYPDDAVVAAIPSTERLFCYPASQPETDLWKILADLAAKRLERFDKKFFREAEAVHFSERRQATAFGRNYRWPEGVRCGDHKNGETVESPEVLRNGIPFQPNPKSGILVVGGETLHLPGPGCSFSGQLSMRLKYSVDELVIGGDVWFQNLPEILSRNPDRYLAGKKVCLLMLSPRMLAANIFPDIQEQNDLYGRLRNQKPLCLLPFKKIKNNFQPAAPVPGERLFQRKQQWNREWLRLAQDGDISSIRLENDGQKQFFTELKLPENQKGKTITLVIHAAGYPGQSNTLLVNGQKIPLFNNTDQPRFHPAAVELPPETQSVKLEFIGKRDNLILIRKIELYQ